MIRTVGMDLSFVGSALVVVDHDERDGAELGATILLDKGSSRFGARALKGIDNLAYVVDGATQFLEDTAPHLVVLEDYAGGGGPNPFTMIQIAEVTGGVKLAMRRLGIPWLEVAALSLKKFVTGKGKGGKHLILEGCYKRWGIGSAELGGDDNTIDAYCLARLGGLYQLTMQEAYTPRQYELEVFKAVRQGGAPRVSKRKKARR